MSKISELSDGGVIQGGDTLIAVRSGGNVKVTYGGSTTANIDGGTIDGTVIGGTTPAAVTTTALVATTADINAGTIDGTVIGGSTPAAGTFTTVTTTGGSTFASTVEITNGGLNLSPAGTANAVINAGASMFINIDSDNNNAGESFYISRDATNTSGARVAKFDAIGDVSFYEDTGTTAKLKWSASDERLGIGTSSPLNSLHIQDSIVHKMILTNSDFVNGTTGTSFDVTFGATSGNTYSEIRHLINGRSAWGDFVLARGGGNVGIGTSSPASELDVAGVTPTLTIKDTQDKSWTGSDTTLGELAFRTSDSSGIGAHNVAFVRAANDVASATTPSGALSFGVSLSNNNASEAMRINSSGQLLIGTTGGSFGAKITAESSTSYTFVSFRTGTASSGHIAFKNGNGAVGSIFTDGTATAYNTSSDQRLKENITDANDAGDKIDAIKVRQYDWKSDGSHQDYGMVAQELMTVAPEAVSGDPESDEMMGVDYSKLVPMMLKEIQSLRARVAQLEGAN